MAYWLPGLACATDVLPGTDGFDVGLADGRRLWVPYWWFPRLASATPAQRSSWRLIGRGIAIHWPEIDEDLSVEGLLRGIRAPNAVAPTAAAPNTVPPDAVPPTAVPPTAVPPNAMPPAPLPPEALSPDATAPAAAAPTGLP